MKKVSMKMPAKTLDVADTWVNARTNDVSEEALSIHAAVPKNVEPMKRLTVDVTETLHKRIKAQCAINGVIMANVIRDILEREFPSA